MKSWFAIQYLANIPFSSEIAFPKYWKVACRIFPLLHSKSHVWTVFSYFAGLVGKRSDVVSEMKRLQMDVDPIVKIFEDQEVSKQLQSSRDVRQLMDYLTKNHNVSCWEWASELFVHHNTQKSHLFGLNFKNLIWKFLYMLIFTHFLLGNMINVAWYPCGICS